MAEQDRPPAGCPDPFREAAGPIDQVRAALGERALRAFRGVRADRDVASLLGNLGSLYESALFMEDFTTFMDSLVAIREDRPSAAPPAKRFLCSGWPRSRCTAGSSTTPVP